MTVIIYTHTKNLEEGDLVLADSSMILVDRVYDHEFDDEMVIEATCVSGNFDKWEEPFMAASDAVWEVLAQP